MSALGAHMALRLLADVAALKGGKVLVTRYASRFKGETSAWKVSGAGESTFSFASPIPYEMLLTLRDAGALVEAPSPGARRAFLRLTENALARLAVEELSGPHK